MAQEPHAVGLLQPAQRSVRVTAGGGGAVRRADDQGEDLLGLGSLVPGDDDAALRRPPARSLHLRDQSLEKGVALRGRSVVHVVGGVGRHPEEGGCGARVQVCGQLRIGHVAVALARVVAHRVEVQKRVVVHVVAARAVLVGQVAGDGHVLHVGLPGDAGACQLVGELRARVRPVLRRRVLRVVLDRA